MSNTKLSLSIRRRIALDLTRQRAAREATGYRIIVAMLAERHASGRLFDRRTAELRRQARLTFDAYIAELAILHRYGSDVDLDTKRTMSATRATARRVHA
jgi:hypothetical protein